jgi:hypothetical protein
MAISNREKEYQLATKWLSSGETGFGDCTKYVQDGYLWNSGMFLFHTDIFAEEVKKHCFDVYDAFGTDNIEEAFKKTPAYP